MTYGGARAASSYGRPVMPRSYAGGAHSYGFDTRSRLQSNRSGPSDYRPPSYSAASVGESFPVDSQNDVDSRPASGAELTQRTTDLSGKAMDSFPTGKV